MKLYTHLNFGGNCEAAFRHYEEHLGGRITMLLRVRDRPPGSPDAVLHARMSLADVELIGNDVPPATFQPVRSSYLYLSLDSGEDAERVYAALVEGGTVGIPIEENLFASRFAQLRDRFGTLWTILSLRHE